MINEAEILQTHPNYAAKLDELLLLRRASTGRLVPIVPVPDSQAAKVLKSAKDNYIYRFFVEGEKAYRNRLLTSVDVPLTAKFANSYAGKIVHAGFEEIQTGLPSEFDIIFQNSITQKKQSLNSFVYDVAREGAIMGAAYIMTDADLAGNPHSFLIPLENVIDWQLGADGLYDLFVYTAQTYTITGRKREAVQIVYEWRRDKLITYSRAGGKAWTQTETPLALKKIPIVKIDFTTDGSSLLLPVAILQVDLINLISEVRQQIRNQAVAILTGPKDAQDLIKSMSVNTFVGLADEARDIKWTVYEARGLDAHFNYVKFLSETMYALAQKNTTDAASSGISKHWDFLDTQSVLAYMGEALSAGLTQVCNLWCEYRGIKPAAQIVVSNRFDFTAAREEIDNLMLGLSAGLGKLADVELKKKLRDTIATLTPEQKRISDDEIMQSVDSKSEIIDALKNFESENQTTGE